MKIKKLLFIINGLWKSTKAGRFVRLAFGYVEPGFGDIIEGFVNKVVSLFSIAGLICLYTDIIFNLGYVEIAKTFSDIVISSFSVYTTVSSVVKFLFMPVIAVKAYLDVKLFWHIMTSIVLVAFPFVYFSY
ncbi:hypothetical protein [Pseudoalteromonas sp. SWN166]|uniref:hypothetical protein n=1 Tax=Pseudoalteromonas sp. SWN166 TaxID=2792061 RepID=UPI0018CDB868|nr:hypothetical protein [Pseudoalteromonas sp. SWN166]MBH0037757.1 hypothetical protein [Pseudoalteromonas sp. SWN166]